MPGYNRGYYNIGDAESTVTGNDRLAAQSQDWMVRQALQAQQLQAQMMDNMLGRQSQERVSGTAAERHGYGMDEEKLRQVGDMAKTNLEETGKNYRTDATMYPSRVQADITQKVFNEGNDVRAAENQARMRGLNFDAKIDTELTNFLNGPAQSQSQPGAAPMAMPSTGGDDRLNTLVKIIQARKGMPVTSAFDDATKRMQAEETQATHWKQLAEDARAAGDTAEMERIQTEHKVRLPSLVTPDSVSSIVQQKLPDYINRDEAWFSGDPGQGDQDSLVQLYLQLVKAFSVQNGGNQELAKQQALAKFQEIAGKNTNQTSDALTDWFGGNTRDLFDRLK